ncbi:MAG: MFS transporter [Oscillospiraceae bacterium]|nr:MFS transporter [Oscillospiraceae bacterium]
MKHREQGMGRRWFYLAVGVIAMLFAGILYAWSILKAPFAADFGWGASELALNFTLAMCFFCLGGLLGAQISKRLGHRPALVGAGVLTALGFGLTACLSGASVGMLYVTYGVLAGLGIGISYNVVISTVSSWFPDQKGLCSGCLMMGFGASALVLGNVANSLFGSSLGWRMTFVLLGIAIGVVLILGALLLKKPGEDVHFPESKKKAALAENFDRKEYTSRQMLSRASFWMAFFCIVFLAAVGSSVISFAKDLALSVKASESLAVTLVGVLSVCNGVGRILTGAVFDALGRKKTMICANLLTICAAAMTLLAVSVSSLPLCIVGLCLSGLSYGSCPTITAAFTSSFYGMKHYSNNMALMTFNVMGGSFVATLSSKLLESTGGYTVPFLMLLVLTLAALGINLCIRRP